MSNLGLGPEQMYAQEQMRREFTTGQHSFYIPYKLRMKRAIEEGLLLFIKYAIVLALAYIALTFMTQIVSGSINGTNSARYLNELQNKGWLPKLQPNGTVVENTNATTNNIK